MRKDFAKCVMLISSLILTFILFTDKKTESQRMYMTFSSSCRSKG